MPRSSVRSPRTVSVSGPVRRLQASPHGALQDWLGLWQAGQYAGMARRMRLPLQAGVRRSAREVRAEFTPGLLSYRLLQPQNTDAAVTVIPAVLTYAAGDSTRTELWRFRMLHLDAAHQPLPRDRRGGQWVVQTRTRILTPPAPTLQA